MSKENKSFLVGVCALILVASILNLWLGVEWFTTLAIASLIGVAAGLSASKLM